MKLVRIPVAMTLLLFVAACVTINVYFPAEAAVKAADRIILDVYGEQPAAPAAPVEPQSRLPYNEAPSSKLMPCLTGLSARPVPRRISP